MLFLHMLLCLFFPNPRIRMYFLVLEKSPRRLTLEVVLGSVKHILVSVLVSPCRLRIHL